MRTDQQHHVLGGELDEGWLVVDTGGWVSDQPRTRRREQVAVVINDLNRSGCFERVKPGLWSFCTEWLLSPVTDAASFRKELSRFFNMEGEERSYPQRVRSQVDTGQPESAVVIEELAPHTGSLVREAVENWSRWERGGKMLGKLWKIQWFLCDL